MYSRLSALSGDVPLYVLDVMCCNDMYAGLSANSQGMLLRAHRAQYMMFSYYGCVVVDPIPISATILVY